MKTYYDILGVTKAADTKAVKSAYRALVKKFHPDVQGGKAVNSKVFEEILLAYTTLTNPEKRKAYDESLAGKKKDTAKKNGFQFREFRTWLFSLSFIRTLFTGKKVSKAARPVDASILDLPSDELLKRIVYSQNRYVQQNAVRALIAGRRREGVQDLLRLLYSGISDEIKIEIIEGLKELEETKLKLIIREIYDIEKSFVVRQAMKKFL